ncbi:hypothetical protein LV780_03745 [Cereibacter azotoformans]|uniref:Uncharacterized protein n=1 Tax=Cereibacter azotoformans TaxID=43057 RepID=A0A2T5JWR3_9RHOB|nr:hypothetical protein [Cereibacter azotoformans]AXQ93001.1 hypothetical protein D0Z66_03735 [Cereibacter sphaeroides]MBO4169311.1 hypothetical protein [Cereibacter azotoformans]PTR14590.1 hypothetical protein C8J28_11662 [Cereibacter azotoformans]UIJ31301.1 hypothetical protein LV780_03745 [Cereibacter azotoformans]
MNSLAVALLDRPFRYRDAARALAVPPALLDPAADAEGLIEFRHALRIALAHHRLRANAARGRKPVRVKRSTFMGRLPAARQALGEEISTIFADAATRVADLPAVHEWDVAARDRVATSLRTASARRHGRRADA